ncbi:hypothetical protein ACFWMU_12595 [Streptomyces sp. NPDC058357]|uniref:hypothetical protein n=1 Tax=unclassified Streptomyces TaxID=2593676 RepID=UPI00365073C0
MAFQDYDHQHVPGICEALGELVRADSHGSVNVEDLYEDLQLWLRRNGKSSVPYGSFARIIRHLGYRVEKRRAYGLAYIQERPQGPSLSMRIRRALR